MPATFLAWLLAAFASSAAGVEIDFLRDGDPPIVAPAVELEVSSRPLPLWIEALSAPEIDLRREAATALVVAHGLKMPDLDTAAPALQKALEDPQQHPAVVAAVAQALVTLDVREAAPALAARARRGDLALAQTIEPALARWNYEPIRERWLERLADPRTRRALLFLAIEGLAAVGETKAAPHLEELVADARAESATRLAAAKALGQIRPDGLEQLAGRLASQSEPQGLLDRLLAAWLLRRHASDEAMQTLMRLAGDAEPAVASAALARLMEHDFRRILPLAEKLAANPDANVRRWAAKAWIAERTPQAIAHLGRLLDDPHPEVRVQVRESLLEMAGDPSLRDAVIAAATAMLAGDGWRGLEQAILIAAALDRKETAGRLVELLDFPRPEVHIAAAWGLRKLAVPETASAVLSKVQRVHAIQMAGRNLEDRPLNTQFCHLVEALQQLQVTESVPLLRKYVPRIMTLNPQARAAAIWAIGHLHTEPLAPDLVGALTERIEDVNSMPPEAVEVRAMCAVTLGRKRSESGLPTLRRFAGQGPAHDDAQYACGWAIHQITGEPLPTFAQPTFPRQPWFLEPLE